jgi:hypothetical protein
MTNEQEEDSPYAFEISCGKCNSDMGYLVLKHEVDKSDRTIDILNEHEMTTICIQCSVESEINKMTSKK